LSISIIITHYGAVDIRFIVDDVTTDNLLDMTTEDHRSDCHQR